MSDDFLITALDTRDFDKIITLGALCHGENYLDYAHLENILEMSTKDGLISSAVCYDKEELIAFRLTYAPGKWCLDKWCTPEDWGIPVDKVSYLKSITVRPDYRRFGLAKRLLKRTINLSKEQGAVAGVAHIWLESPEQAAYKYFLNAGARLVKMHPNRWSVDCIEIGYRCVRCGNNCVCTAAEMILTFGEKHE